MKKCHIFRLKHISSFQKPIIFYVIISLVKYLSFLGLDLNAKIYHDMPFYIVF